uniref:Putative reverse transcriptase domain-containing protein n=1 Tax=Tanacetum cinerariifolium TaxID=118510 RepID=A0A699H7B5_TANCI|nr:putative reverse transcriptase domain-containing protein [Tanacetum cinerariifolium]
MEREFKKLKRSRIAIVKVRWNSKRGPEFTWEREDQLKLKSYADVITFACDLSCYWRLSLRVVAGTDDGGLGGGGYLRDYVWYVGGTDDGDKGTDIMKDKVSQEYVCEEEVPLNNNIVKQIGDFVDMPDEAVEQGMDVNVLDEIDGAKGEQVPNHVVKNGNLEFIVCKKVANPGVNGLVDKGNLKNKKSLYAE